MADIPGLKSDVFYGDAEKPLPDWREEMPESADDNDDDEPTDADLAGIKAVLGFDPAELWPEDDPRPDGRPGPPQPG